jgi:GDP-L-fucose synthase
MNNKSEILILGGNGLVGSSFSYGYKATKNDADLTKLDDVLRLIENKKPKWIINCAGYVGGVQANMIYKWEFFKKNILINMNVIEASMQLGVPNVISFLSTCIFPDNLTVIKDLEETDLHLGEPHDSNYPYAYSKRMIDVMSRIAREKGFNYSSIIPCNIYGLNDNYHLINSHIVPALIHKFYLAYQKSISENKPQSVEIWGSGNPLREFIYANDIPILINQIINKNINFDNLILSPDNAISIKELAQTINNIFALKYLHTSADVSIYFNTDKPDGQYKKSTNNSKLKELIDFKFTPLKEGLIQSIDYFTDKYENDRNNLKL